MERFETEPESVRSEMELMLLDRLTSDKQLAEDVAAIIGGVRTGGPHIVVVQRARDAEELLGAEARRLTRGTLQTIQEADTLRKASGVKIDEIG